MRPTERPRPLTSALLPSTRRRLKTAHIELFLSDDPALQNLPEWRVLDAVVAWALTQDVNLGPLVRQRLAADSHRGADEDPPDIDTDEDDDWG